MSEVTVRVLGILRGHVTFGFLQTTKSDYRSIVRIDLFGQAPYML